MPPDRTDLPPGLYERLITKALAGRLLEFDPARTRVAKAPIDPAEAHDVLARHVERIAARALRGLPHEERLQRQGELANALIGLLGGSDEAAANEAVALPPEELRAIREMTGGAVVDVDVPAPLVALSASDLLVNARGEPGLAQNLAREIPSADSIDLLCAFVRWYGLRVLEEPLRAHCRAGKPLRVITTVYTGSTERKALEWLKSLGAEVKVSFDTRSTRLHAKAWLFTRCTGYSTAYIGSSNLSKSALLDGVEWNVRLSEVSSADILAKFGATFDAYWSSAEYETYRGEEDRDRLDLALARAGKSTTAGDDLPLSYLDVTPYPYQTEMLEKLALERMRHDRHRNLVVAATGTGKTIVSALDFKRLRKEMGDPTMLFVAHRQEILRQSAGAFRQVLRESDFGELYVDGTRPDRWRHVFASIQSLARVDLADLSPTHFDVVVIDEFHHAAAASYRRLLDHIQPRELIGLTATPDRADGESVTSFFDDHISDFHWESQSTQTQAGKAGQRYIRHRELGGHILLFVRQRKKDGARTMPYTFLGPADYVSHQQERPIQFVWRLRRPMPADFFREAKVVGG